MSMDLSFLLFLRPMPRSATPPENPKPEGGELERASEVEDVEAAEEGSANDRAPAERINERGAEETDDDRIDTRLLRER